MILRGIRMPMSGDLKLISDGGHALAAQAQAQRGALSTLVLLLSVF